jgi:Ca-activated chloride channel family protein
MGNAPQFRFEHWQMLWLLGLVAAAAALIWLGFRLKDRALRAFARVESLRHIAASSSRPRQVTKAALLVAALVCVVLALMRPQGAPREVAITKRGRDIVFLLDVSRSMLARDLQPSRLERAKLAIEEMLDVMEGDRVSLIVFAGNWALKCPLTHDYHFFKMALRSASPDDVGRGGTDLGDAIRVAVNHVLRPPEPDEQGHGPPDQITRDIVLITDGEDLEDSGPVSAAQVAAKYGVRITTVGLGDPDGARVPASGGGYVTYDGQEVRSRLDENTLRETAAATKGGRYVGVRTGAMDLTELYRRYLAGGSEHEKTYHAVRYRELYQWPLFAAVVLLVVEALLTGRRPNILKAHQ